MDMSKAAVLSLSDPKPRKRRFNPKVRTGCKTCRERRVKCGEEKPACKRCVSSGRMCDGYETIRIAKAITSKTGEVTLQWVRPSSQPPDTNAEEQSAFHHFRLHVLESLAGPFDPCVWHRQVLSISMTEAAVRNAVIALGAIGKEDEDGNNTEFALKHYSLGMRALQEKIPMQGPTSQYLVLVTCLLFVAFEFQHRGWAEAKQHLDGGLNIIRELQEGPSNASHALSSPSLVEAFERLDIQMSLFTAGRVHLNRMVKDICLEKLTNNMEFRDVRDALRHLNLRMAAMRELVHCADQARFSPAGMSMDELESFEVDLTQQLTSLDHWEIAMNDLLTRLPRPRDQQAARILQTHYICCRLMVSTCLTDGHEDLWDGYLREFERIITLIEEIQRDTPMPKPGKRHCRGFKLDMGIIPPLYFTAMKCRDPSFRRRAINALRNCEHQEGAWDGQTMVGLAASVMQVEERGTDPQVAADIPERNRLYRAWYDLTKTRSVLYCRRRRFEVDGQWIGYEEHLD